MSTETKSLLSLLPTVHFMREEGPRAYIMALARTLPCLEHKMEMWGNKRWDIDQFMEWSAPWSSGEKLCARFIASVWNPGYAAEKGWLLDVTDVATLSTQERLIITHWIINPVWP